MSRRLRFDERANDRCCIVGLAGEQEVERGGDGKLRLQSRGSARGFDQFAIQFGGGQPMALVGFHFGQDESRLISGRRVEELADNFCKCVAVAGADRGFELATRGGAVQQLVSLVTFRRKFADQLSCGCLQAELLVVVAGALEKRIFIASENSLQECQHLVVFVIGQSFAGAGDRPR